MNNILDKFQKQQETAAIKQKILEVLCMNVNDEVEQLEVLKEMVEMYEAELNIKMGGK